MSEAETSTQDLTVVVGCACGAKIEITADTAMREQLRAFLAEHDTCRQPATEG